MNTKIIYRSRVRPQLVREMVLKGSLPKRDFDSILKLFGVMSTGFIPLRIGFKNLFEGASFGSTIYSERKRLSDVIHEIVDVEETQDAVTVNLTATEFKKRLATRDVF